MPIILPFVRRANHILLDARVNDAPATLVLDTGSGMCALDAGFAAAIGVESGKSAQALGVDSVSIALATMHTLRMGGVVEFRDEPAALVPLDEGTARHGVPIHGTVGFSFFSRYVVEIDYAGSRLLLHDPQTFVYAGRGERIAIDVSKRVPLLQAEVTARDGAVIPVQLLLDLGTAGYGSVLTKGFVDRHAASLASAPSIERVLGAGVGGSIHGRVSTLTELRLGRLKVPNPVVAIPSSPRGFFGVTWVDGTLGAPILSRMRVILDYAHGAVILEPEAPLDAPFPYDASGLSLRATGPQLERVVVDGVAPDSAGARAGLAVDDVLERVDGRVADGPALEWIDETLTRAGSHVMLRIRRNGQTMEVLLTLASALDPAMASPSSA